MKEAKNTRYVIVRSGALHTMTVKGKEIIVLRGVIDHNTLLGIRADEYQREVLTGHAQIELMRALEESSVPDIELGMRGEEFDCQTIRDETGNHDVITLKSPVYVIDGLQRISAAINLMSQKATATPTIGATVFFNTTSEWERERFRIVNQERARVSPNILLRNATVNNDALDFLYKLTHRDDFILGGRVQWSQRMNRGHLLTGLNFLKIVGRLHYGLTQSGRWSTVEDITNPNGGIKKMVEKIGKGKVEANIREFLDIVDQAFGIRNVALATECPYTKFGFLSTLAKMFASYDVFWRDKKLIVDVATRRKISQFPIRDGSIAQLCNGNNSAQSLLLLHLVRHINSGRRTNRLSLDAIGADEETDDCESGPIE